MKKRGRKCEMERKYNPPGKFIIHDFMNGGEFWWHSNWLGGILSPHSFPPIPPISHPAPVTVRLSLSMHFHFFVNFIFILSFLCCPCKSSSKHWDHPLRSCIEQWRIVREYLQLFMFATMFQFLLKWRKIFEEWFMSLWTVCISLYLQQLHHQGKGLSLGWWFVHFLTLCHHKGWVEWNISKDGCGYSILHIQCIYPLQDKSMIFSNEFHPLCSWILITNKLQINID